ncbi:hypothetical protein EO98_10210 [Methanosarcina sp. 2.H.T.1A.6]|nr:hypothetical protein EO94_16590 [Methanosarcina sp. 2.H.T.1A.3]KKG19808.1 hypothetical protein EO98_10210 [Methanosarcina sp. 2.H.T.1A.6]KKG27191.1 hypothetical protein EO96_09595 [Methanosarcina sp. 2.H.T.1A.8]KKG28922.1 hypothetical protein EO97_04710 [Methanosarcina sp. 2.H.T.1A.15]
MKFFTGIHELELERSIQQNLKIYRVQYLIPDIFENEKRPQYVGIKNLAEVLKWLDVLSVGRMKIRC